MDKLSLRDRVTIITGGGQGLGRGMAEALAQAGSHIVIAQRNLQTAEEAAHELEKEGVRCLAIQADITDPGQVENMVARVMDEFGKIDVLFNNSGVCILGKAEEMSLEDWNSVINTNLTGSFIVSQQVGRVMIQQKRGSIVNISSMSGMIVNTPQLQCSYNVSKAGLIMLTKSLATEWAPHNIRVNTIASGYMRTAISQEHYDRGDPMIQRWFDFTPMGRSGVPEELGGIALYLASDAASFTTGGVFVIDGGYTCW